MVASAGSSIPSTLSNTKIVLRTADLLVYSMEVSHTARWEALSPPSSCVRLSLAP